MTWQALVPPRKGTQDYAGMCLRYAQSFFGAPVRHRSAWDAWNATQHKHGTNEALPGVPVILWFSHFGTYQNEYGNWGHVAIHVPGDAIYTSPGYGYGFERWATIAQIEQRFASKYVGWSEDINGLRVAQQSGKPAPQPTRSRKVKTMLLCWDTIGTGYLVTPDGTHGLASPQVYNLFYRLINSDQLKTPFGSQVAGFVGGVKSGMPDTFLKAEMDIINANLKIIATSVRTGVAVDVEKTAAALSDALGKKFDPSVELDVEDLARAFDTAAPRIAASMVKQAGEKMAS